METQRPKVILSVDDYAGVEIVVHDTTAQHIRQQHPDFSVSDIRGCLEDPVFVHTNPQDHEHPDRHNYYSVAERGPKYRRVVVDHSTSPSVVKTALRTERIGNFGDVVYMKPSGGTP